MAFQLKGNRKETENKTIRFPLHLIDQIEQQFPILTRTLRFPVL
mgnify:CR=1 FL=1